MAFQPPWSWPFVAALTRRIHGEHIGLKFRATELETADYGTIVAVSGKVGSGDDKVASQEFWTSVLAGGPEVPVGGTRSSSR